MKKLFLVVAFFTLLTGMVYADDLSTGKGSSAYGDYYSTNYPSKAWGNTNSTATLWATNNAAATERNNSIDLNGTYTYAITNVIWRGYDGSSTYGYGTMRVYYSNDNSTWTLAQAITGNTLGQRQFNFSAISARYWRFGATAPYGDTIYGYTSGLWVYGTTMAGTSILINQPLAGLTYIQNSTVANVTVQSSTNSSGMMVYYQLNSGTAAFYGYLSNGTSTLKAIATSSGSNNLTIILFDGIVNSSQSVVYTQEGGLILTASNVTTGEQINANWQVGNETNKTTTTSTTLANGTIQRGLVPSIVNITGSASGYANATLQNIVVSNTSAGWYNLSLWRLQEFKVVDAITNSSLSTFSLVVSSGSNYSYYSTTNGSILVSRGDIPSGSFVVSYIATGYNTTNFTFSNNATSEINYTASIYGSGLIIFYYDEASCVSSCRAIYGSWLASNGTNTNNSYSQAANFFSNLSYTDLPTGTLTFTFNNSVNGSYASRTYIATISSTSAQTLNVYLLNSSSTVQLATYCVQNAGGSPITTASVTIQRSFSGSYVTVAQGTGGATGCYTFYLDFTVNYQVVASATGYTSYTAVSMPVSSQIIRLSAGSASIGFQTAYADTLDLVQTIIQPYGTSLGGDWVLVNFTVYSVNATLTNWGMTCNYNGTDIYNTNVTTSPSGGSTTSNVTLTNKTGSFYCFGLFDRSGYNTSYVNRTFYIGFSNSSYSNVSLYQIINTTAGQSWSPQVKAGVAIISTMGLVAFGAATIGAASAGIIAIFSMGIFVMALQFIPMSWFILFVIVGLSYTWFTSRQF